MLLNNVLRPVASNLLRIPARNSSGVCGAKSRHVSVLVSIGLFLGSTTHFVLDGNVIDFVEGSFDIESIQFCRTKFRWILKAIRISTFS